MLYFIIWLSVSLLIFIGTAAGVRLNFIPYKTLEDKIAIDNIHIYGLFWPIILLIAVCFAAPIFLIGWLFNTLWSLISGKK